MRILQATSEFFPYSKTGGLADMVAGLSGALAELGEDVTVATPLYRGIRDRFSGMKPIGGEFTLPLGKQFFTGQWWHLEDESGLTILFLENAGFYDRPGIYMDGSDGYWDNPERFMFFSKAIARIAPEYDAVHVHDWQTAFVPMLLKVAGGTALPRTLLSIHNLAYQGQCDGDRFVISNLPDDTFDSEGPEYWGSLNFLKAGLHYADALSTVSPSYAREILTPEFGEGLDGVLRHREDSLTGILNGVDYKEWNTTQNPRLPATYSVDDLTGKVVCKKRLLEEMGLPASSLPLFGVVSRLAHQKGIDVLVECLTEILCEKTMQIVILGDGDQSIASKLVKLRDQHPEYMQFVHGYDHDLAHRIEAGIDFFMMPSRFEPCGLNQIYSMKYGAVPLVHRVGGLRDTVNCENGPSRTGIEIRNVTIRDISSAVHDACQMYSNTREYQITQAAGMKSVFSWKDSAGHYQSILSS